MLQSLIRMTVPPTEMAVFWLRSPRTLPCNPSAADSGVSALAVQLTTFRPSLRCHLARLFDSSENCTNRNWKRYSLQTLPRLMENAKKVRMNSTPMPSKFDIFCQGTAKYFYLSINSIFSPDNTVHGILCFQRPGGQLATNLRFPEIYLL